MPKSFVKKLSDQSEIVRAGGFPPRWLVLFVVCGFLAVLVSGCSSLTNQDNDFYLNGLGHPPEVQALAGNVDYSTNLLHEGDVVDINFQYSTNFNTLQKINLDGALNLNSVGMVKAAGLTVMGLQQEVIQLYKPQVKDDVITVKLANSEASVYVGGSVIKAGQVEIDRPLTVLEAIVDAGGLDTSRAKLSDVKVLRIVKGKQCVYSVNLKRVLAGKEPSPFYLEPFDIIYVPAKTFNY